MNMVAAAISSCCSSPFSSALLRFPENWRCFSSKTLISSYLGTTRRWKNSNSMSHKLYSSITACKSTSFTAAQVDGDEVPEPPVKKPQPWLIVGLGNPGKKYDGTRHNVGFEMVDSIAQAEGISMSSVSFKSLFGKGFIGNVPVMLAKPQTFMNVSGESVGAIVSYYKIPVKQVLVIFDDLDLPFAKLRLLPKGGHGGHNGMKSVINHLKGSRDFPRLRIGIGRPPGKMDPANFVLRPFNKQEREELDFTFQNGVEAMRILLLQGFDKSAKFVNTAKALEHFASRKTLPSTSGKASLSSKRKIRGWVRQRTRIDPTNLHVIALKELVGNWMLKFLRRVLVVLNDR